MKIILTKREMEQCKCGGFKTLCEYHGKPRKYKNDKEKAKINQRNYILRKKQKQDENNTG
jgi:hypothetical protein